MLVSWTVTGPRRCRLFLVDFFVRMWRLNAWPRLTVPPGRTRNRFAALFLVFIFGMTSLPSSFAPAGAAGLSVVLQACSRFCSAGRRGPTGLLCSVFLLPLRRQHHDHLPAFELGHVLHHRDIRQLVANALQKAHADVLVGDL